MKRRNFITTALAGLAVTTVALPLRLKATTRRNAFTLADRWVLRQQDAETLAEWYCILNSWGWPALLPDPEPPTYISDGRRSQIMAWIHSRIGYEAHLWKHNQSVMSRAQFNDFMRMDPVAYKDKYPFDSRDFNEELRKRDAHMRAIYARHGARHMRYEES